LTIQDIEMQDISFGDMLDNYLYKMPERGQILEATVIEADENEILLDVGLKRDAVVTRKDLSYLNQDVIDSLVPGKKTLAYVLQPYSNDEQLVVSINKALELEDWQKAKELMEASETIMVTSVGVNRGGALVRFGRLQGFIPNSHLYTNKNEIEGKEIEVKVIEIERQRNRLVFSEREAIFEAKKARMETMNVGDVMVGKVVHMTDFGAFVDLGGADGLVHVSNIVHQHISHPSAALEVGQEIEVRIEEIDIERERISLNRKVLLPDPWETFTARYNVGDLVTGRVTNVVDYGIFVSAPGGMEGLVHTSKMQSLNLSHPSDMFKSGDEVLIRILDIDFNRQRVQMDIDSLSVDEQVEWMQERRDDMADDETETDADTHHDTDETTVITAE
jgi:small subunit ribosomal protein S1